MSQQSSVTEPRSFRRGDRVRIKYYAGKPGRIVEERGPLGPGGALVYRVLISRDPVNSYIEVREDQLELVTSVAVTDRASPSE